MRVRGTEMIGTLDRLVARGFVASCSIDRDRETEMETETEIEKQT